MRRTLALAWLAALLSAAPAHASLVVEIISDSPVDCHAPALACATDQAPLVVWSAADGHVRSAFVPSICIPDLVPAGREIHDHGLGIHPCVASTWRGYIVVWAQGTRIIHQFAWPQPDPPDTLDVGVDLTDATLDVHGVTDAGSNVAWIAIGTPDGMVRFVRVTKGPTLDPVTLVSGLPEPGLPQVTETPHWPDPLARVYYRRQGESLAYRGEADDGVWGDEVLVPEGWAIDNGFDAASALTGQQTLLGLGPQPTCPCGTIHAIRQDDEGVWQPQEDLTAHHDAYDWPLTAGVGIDAQGRSHAFWLQEERDESWSYVRRRLEYWVHEPEGWVDAGGILAPHQDPGLGLETALALTAAGNPVFAWTQRDTVDSVPQPQQIAVGIMDPLSPVAQEVQRAAVALSARPNPFNPATAVTFELPAPATVSLTVHDLQGRLVRTLAAAVAREAGHHEVTWRGDDDAGAAVASGTYICRLTAGGRQASVRLVLVR